MELSVLTVRTVAIAAALLLAAGPSSAQTIGFAEAIDQLGRACGKDIAKFCKQASLGGGRIQQCLGQSNVSSACSGSLAALKALLQKRAAARNALPRTCASDIGRLCAGVVPGDGNLMECFYKAKRNISAPCQQAVADAGYEVGLAPSSGSGSVQLSSAKLVESLQGVETVAAAISAARLRELAEQSINDPSRAARVNRPPLTGDLEKLAQLTIAVQFDLNSARIRPDSFRALGLMADSLYHPYLQGYRFLIVGHTDARGDRRYNLKLSQERAEAIRAALLIPFGIAPGRIESVGLGEEQLLNSQNPEAGENRRVQLINIGPIRQ
jgi:outer membrane protein OmpA-like peptidoglycan-associated protein